MDAVDNSMDSTSVEVQQQHQLWEHHKDKFKDKYKDKLQQATSSETNSWTAAKIAWVALLAMISTMPLVSSRLALQKDTSPMLLLMVQVLSLLVSSNSETSDIAQIILHYYIT